MITISTQGYLEAVAYAEAEGERVLSSTLAPSLGVPRSAVTAGLKRLKKEGLVSIETDGCVRLTKEGHRIAAHTLFRRHLVERMLAEIFGLPWHAVYEEAQALERVVSPALEKKLIEVLGKDEPCPHGHRLAFRSALDRRKNGWRLLSEAEKSKKYQIISVYERDRKLLEFFDREGIRPGIPVVVQSQNYDGTITLTIGNKSFRLGLPAAGKIWVTTA